MSFTNENVDYFDSTSTCRSTTTGSAALAEQVLGALHELLRVVR
jgi:hypothetical protein